MGISNLAYRFAIATFVVLLTIAAASPTSASAWGGKPWNAMHTSIECTLQINPMLAGSVLGRIECDEQRKTVLDSFHPAMLSDTFTAAILGNSQISFSLRPYLAPLSNRHGAMLCSGSWARSAFGSLTVINDFGVRCQWPGHADIACTDFLSNTSSMSSSDSITLQCEPMEYFDGKRWIYWDIDHGYDASVIVRIIKGGIVRAIPVDPQPDLVSLVRFKIQNRSTKKTETRDVVVMTGRADLVIAKPGIYLVTAYFCNSSTCETILYVSERMAVTK